MSQRDAVEMLLTRDEIRQLPLRYAAAIESRDIDAMVAYMQTLKCKK